MKNEFYSAHVYLSMSSWFEDKGLLGFAKWMRVQNGEELEHGPKISDFINHRDGRALVLGFDAPVLATSLIQACFREIWPLHAARR